jgi:Family of unknown function (DUF5681)
MFEKGKSGNPNGRPPKGKAITDEIRKYLAETSDEGLTKAQAIAAVWIKKVMEGDTTALKLLVEHLEGKAVQPISGDEDRPSLLDGIQIIINESKPDNTD